MDAFRGTFNVLGDAECWELLRTHEVGRVAAHTDEGSLVLPVHYVLDQQRIVFRTSTGGSLSALADGATVAFQVDDIDVETQTGWSVLARGTSGTAVAPVSRAPQPWVHDERDLWIAITVERVSGRLVEK